VADPTPDPHHVHLLPSRSRSARSSSCSSSRRRRKRASASDRDKSLGSHGSTAGRSQSPTTRSIETQSVIACACCPSWPRGRAGRANSRERPGHGSDPRLLCPTGVPTGQPRLRARAVGGPPERPFGSGLWPRLSRRPDRVRQSPSLPRADAGYLRQQHVDHSPRRLVLLQVDQQLPEGARLR
jgi:hypothetical protein